MLVFLGGVLMLAACNKPETRKGTDAPAKSNVVAMGTESESPANANNPMDAAGAWHNYELEQLQLLPMDGSETLQEMIDMQRTWRLQHGLPVVDAEELAAKITFIIDDADHGFSHIADASHLSDEGKAYVAYLAGVAQTQYDVNFTTFKSMMIAQENAIMNNDQLNDAERDRLLAMYAIARYSYFYHANPNPFTDFNPPPVTPEPAGMMIFTHATVRAIIDCVGYILGSDVDYNTSPAQAHEHGLAAAAEASDRFDHGVAPFD